MRWPWSRRHVEKLVVVHELGPEARSAVGHLVAAIDAAAASSAAAVRYAARQDRAAREYAARVGAQLVHAKQPVVEVADPEWAAFVASEPNVEEAEMEDLRTHRRRLQGVDPSTPEERGRAIRHYAAAVATYGAPPVEARMG